MKRIYLFFFIASMFVVACTPTGVVEKTVKRTSNSAAMSYKTVTITDGIPSPRKEMRGKIGANTLNVNYGSPSVKGREVMGGLVPYGKIWRMGANEATTFQSSIDLKIEGKNLPAGKYSLFTIPSEKGKWTVIFNSVAEQWGAYKYSKSKDVLRVEATARTTSKNQEALEFVIDGSSLVMKWEKTWLLIQMGI